MEKIRFTDFHLLNLHMVEKDQAFEAKENELKSVGEEHANFEQMYHVIVLYTPPLNNKITNYSDLRSVNFIIPLH